MLKRKENRKANELRSVFLGPGFAKFAQGSCFVKFGNTHVLCAATIEEKVPPFLRHSGTGWVTAEYGMLPCSSKDRIDREAFKGRQTGRTHEIQRLIGRSLRAVIDLNMLGERSVRIDCDVLQADGGTRTASITGAYVALHQALQKLVQQKKIPRSPLKDFVAAISCGIVDGVPLLDLDYDEDSCAEVDSNFILTSTNSIVEIQTAAEKSAFKEELFFDMLALAKEGIQNLITRQKEVIKGF